MMGNVALQCDDGTSGCSNVIQKPLILVVDDEVAIRGTLCQVLSDENYETTCAEDGEHALLAVEAMKPQVVLLDIWMPGLDGVKTLDRIKELSPNTEVVMMSGHATIATALETTKRGACDFIEKPLDIEVVMTAVRKALHSYYAKRGVDEAGAMEHGEASQLLPHLGVTSRGLAGCNIGQRTLKRSAIFYGQGLHSGQKSGLVLEPLPLNSGIHFARIGTNSSVPAFFDYVRSTNFATTVRHGEVSAATVEHLLSALHAFGISNLLIKCNGEVPILDGSAVEFCKELLDAGIEEQGGDWFEIKLTEPVTVELTNKAGGVETITLRPSDTLKINYTLSYPEPVGKQVYHYAHSGAESFVSEIAPARTFGFLHDIERLQRAGLAAGGRLDNFILIGQDGVVNTSLRFADELARHKILDIMGDLFLLGRPLCVEIDACMTGHFDNVKVLEALRASI